MKIAVAMLSMGHVDADFAASLAALFAYEAARGENELFIINIQSSTTTLARNKAIETALKNKADRVLFIDADIIFPCDSLQRLLSFKKDVIAASYPKRSSEKTLNFLPVRNRERYDDLELEPVAAIGTGFLLIDCKLFVVIAQPWFDWFYHSQEQIKADKYIDDLFLNIKPDRYPVYITEDYYFCAKARRYGYEIYMDKALTKRLGHAGKKIYTFDELVN